MSREAQPRLGHHRQHLQQEDHNVGRRGHQGARNPGVTLPIAADHAHVVRSDNSGTTWNFTTYLQPEPEDHGHGPTPASNAWPDGPVKSAPAGWFGCRRHGRSRQRTPSVTRTRARLPTGNAGVDPARYIGKDVRSVLGRWCNQGLRLFAATAGTDRNRRPDSGTRLHEDHGGAGSYPSRCSPTRSSAASSRTPRRPSSPRLTSASSTAPTARPLLPRTLGAAPLPAALSSRMLRASPGSWSNRAPGSIPPSGPATGS